MPYLTRDIARRRAKGAPRPPVSGLGVVSGDPRLGTTAEWEAYESRIQWRRTAARTGPRTTEWAKQSAWAAQALQQLIAGESVTVQPPPSDPELLALIINGRAWLITLPDWELFDIFPGLTPQILARARRLLLPGRDVVAIATAKVQADIGKLATDLARLQQLNVETQRYVQFAQDTLKQFQTYVTWLQHHLKKKAKKTQVVAGALQAVSTVLYFIPVVGWALGLLVDAANVAFQLDRMKGAIAAMQAAGAKVQAAQVYVALMESLGVTMADLDNALGAVEWQLAFQREMLTNLEKIRMSAVGGGPQPTGVAPPSGATPLTAASDSAIVNALFGEARQAFQAIAAAPGTLIAVVVAGVAVVLALVTRRRR